MRCSSGAGANLNELERSEGGGRKGPREPTREHLAQHLALPRQHRQGLAVLDGVIQAYPEA